MVTILDCYILRRFAVAYVPLVALFSLVVLAAAFFGLHDAGIVDALPLLCLPSGIAATVAFSEVAERNELIALYASGVSLLRISRSPLLCGVLTPLLIVAVSPLAMTGAHVWASIALAAGSSAVAISAAAVSAAEFSRREPGIVWLATLGTLLLYGFCTTTYTALGDHPIFEIWCASIQTILFLAAIWYVHRHLREWL